MTVESLWEKESRYALRAVSTCSELAQEVGDRSIVAVKESSRDVVTDLDLRFEREVEKILAPLGHRIIGEESFEAGQSLFKKNGAPVWFVDPIDGTANFANGIPFYAISAGLSIAREDRLTGVESLEFVCGAVALPALREIYFTQGTRGSFLNGRPLAPPMKCELKTALIGAGFSSSKKDLDERTRQFQLFGSLNDQSRGCLRLGSAAGNLCFLASGRFQAAYGVEAYLWDVAGGLALAKRAGFQLLYCRHGDSPKVDYLAGTPELNAQVVELGIELGVWKKNQLKEIS